MCIDWPRQRLFGARDIIIWISHNIVLMTDQIFIDSLDSLRGTETTVCIIRTSSYYQ